MELCQLRTKKFIIKIHFPLVSSISQFFKLQFVCFCHSVDTRKRFHCILFDKTFVCTKLKFTPKKMDFTDKVILITGASSGIGAETARQFAKLGGKIALVGRNEGRLNRVVEQIINDGGEAFAIVADITTDAERIINETIEHFEKLNVLINNAGIVQAGPFMDMDIEIFDNIMNTNVRGIIHLTKLAIPHLEATKGNIVNVSSLAGIIVFKTATYYNISKAALDQFTNCAAVEFGPRGIRVNSVNPSMVKTPFFENNGMSEDQAKELEDSLGAKYPLQRIATPSDVSNAIAFFANDSSDFVTGVIMNVDGGALRAGAY